MVRGTHTCMLELLGVWDVVGKHGARTLAVFLVLLPIRFLT